MHQGNRDWLNSLQDRYAEQMKTARLLEVGSLNLNGSAKEHLHPAVHIGIDIVAGPDVDIQCDAAETSFEPESFDIILSTSMLEHNPHWRRGLTHNLQWLKHGGLFFLSWGAEGNPPHAPEPFAFVPVGDVLEWAMESKLTVIDAYWELHRHTYDCPGCYDMVLVKP